MTSPEPEHGGSRAGGGVRRPYRVPAALAQALLAEPPAWQERALCAQTDPDAFFPEKGQDQLVAIAKEICGRCPVQGECLEYLLTHDDEKFGIWAGLTKNQRTRTLPAARAAHQAALQQSQREDTGRQTAERERDQAGRDRRMESALPPGAGRHRGGVGSAGTLPTEPRRPRGQPRLTRPPSTFPTRARTAPDATAPSTAPSPPRTARPARGRPSRSQGASDPTATTTPDPTPTAEDQLHEEDADEVTRAVREVLAAQPTAPDLDPAAVTALATDPQPQPDTAPAGGELAGRWTLRVAAVARVLSGRATRGQTARAFGIASQQVAHWVARHRQAMTLLEDRRRRGPSVRASRRAAVRARQPRRARRRRRRRRAPGRRPDRGGPARGRRTVLRDRRRGHPRPAHPPRTRGVHHPGPRDPTRHPPRPHRQRRPHPHSLT